MNCIILGDKYQKRMKSKGCVGLIKVNNKPIIEHQYRNIKKIFPLSKIIYIYGFEGKRLNAFVSKNQASYQDMTMVHNANYDTKNSGYSLFLASQYLNDDCLIIFGDYLLNRKMFSKFDSSIVSSRAFINKKNKGKLGCIIDNNKIENIAYDLDNYLTDVYYINKKHALMIKNYLNNTKNHNCFIFELINKLIDDNQTICPIFTEYHSLPLILSK